MKSQLECIPCFVRQALDALKQVTDDEILIHRVLKSVLKEASEFDLNLSPPEMGQIIHRIIRSETDCKDPYSEIKKMSDECALGLSGDIKLKIGSSHKPFLNAVKFAIAGNILDFALISSWDEDRIQQSFDTAMNKQLDEYYITQLEKDILDAETILILGDNAGETVFDKILIENFNTKADVYYVVKESPIINDAVYEDAVSAGINDLAQIISNGTDAPGTLLSQCSKNFLDLYDKADVVIAKGQANFETLNDEKRKIYFLTQMKCRVIAKRYGYEVGDWIAAPSNALTKGDIK